MPTTTLLLLLALTSNCFADIYLHNPRGSNNRLNEKSANRRNANRCFDSQNNNRGGYNVGDKTNQAFTAETGQHRMRYFQSGPTSGRGKSTLLLEWTNQHGCGGNEDTDPHKVNCNLVMQYMCQPQQGGPADDRDKLRNGANTLRQDYSPLNNARELRTETQQQKQNRKNGNVKSDRALQESWEWYDKCRIRQRNQGLFTADQRLRTNNGLGYSAAIYTRQNPNGNRYGYECPEERDYYPYWHPTDWKDIAIMPFNTSLCNWYQSESFNVKKQFECIENYPNSNNVRHRSRWNNEADCQSNGGQWIGFTNYLEYAPQLTTETACNAANGNAASPRYIWGIPHDALATRLQSRCLVALPAPDCVTAPWTRDNHLGNTRVGQASRYLWTLPHFPSGKEHNCIIRIRYNISTDDYDPFKTNSSHNENRVLGIQSPVQQNPNIDIGAGNSPLRLAINTAQYGRTFQDRSHVIKLMPRPAGLESSTIHNINVRGKRGNIVQTYPAVEYDFIPNDIKIKANDLIHFQWAGSNTHNNGNPAGDGQAGDAGEGTRGTDRNNIAQIRDKMENFPVPFENSTLWKNAELIWSGVGQPSSSSSEDIAVTMASAEDLFMHVCLKI
ncbi:uncharacterized protein TRIADDRAFT_55329 [Trichoplax adhaerens]|uniref:Protein DD3-3 n=1 Tax=Trichoplax adhaerens TaxID=10228 RepID=B3RUL0_TRIAD|nr:hypothetical protein TRIADDRAFT_55329 [Trichoplax adhaerens]EDV25347.1 hypothetical protein TRIADDRAFT_55329 [Trichoplax adhaerens]|eukprot:XP_002111380.1 hypothetical protein TRIADDRAFT_55329 [Trichoplax adhaerens]